MEAIVTASFLWPKSYCQALLGTGCLIRREAIVFRIGGEQDLDLSYHLQLPQFHDQKTHICY
jgi:hypothetical protein